MRSTSQKIRLLTLTLFLLSLIGSAFHTHAHQSEPQSSECSACAFLHNGKTTTLAAPAKIHQTLFTAGESLDEDITLFVTRSARTYSSRAPPLV